jgi:Spy/CpxP family protein refolding chaperone
MKRTLLSLATGLFIALFALGAALAADTQSRQSAPTASQAQERSDSSTSGQAQGAESVLGSEAPWISLALANAEALGLSADQRKTLEGLRSEYQERAVHHQELIEKSENDLQKLLSATPVNIDQVRAALNTIGSLNVSMRLSRIETLIKGKAVLSAEQRAKLQTLVAKAAGKGDGSMMGHKHDSDDCDRETK